MTNINKNVNRYTHYDEITADMISDLTTIKRSHTPDIDKQVGTTPRPKTFCYHRHCKSLYLVLVDVQEDSDGSHACLIVWFLKTFRNYSPILIQVTLDFTTPDIS